SLPVAEDQDMWIRLALIGDVEFVPESLTIVHDVPRSLTKVYARKVDKYVLPMIQRHIRDQRQHLSAAEIREIKGARFSSVGRNLYASGSYLRGGWLLLKAISLRYRIR